MFIHTYIYIGGWGYACIRVMILDTKLLSHPLSGMCIPPAGGAYPELSLLVRSSCHHWRGLPGGRSFNGRFGPRRLVIRRPGPRGRVRADDRLQLCPVAGPTVAAQAARCAVLAQEPEAKKNRHQTLCTLVCFRVLFLDEAIKSPAGLCSNGL